MNTPSNNDFDSILSNRRSIRRYKEQTPSSEDLNKMICSALLSPAPSQQHPIKFIRIKSQEIRENLELNMRQGYEQLIQEIKKIKEAKKLINWVNFYWRHVAFMFHAPILLLVASDQDSLSKGFLYKLKEFHIHRDEEGEKHNIDLSAGLALENFLLKGSQLGLGTCLLTAPFAFLSRKNVKTILSIDESLSLNCFITVGFADEIPQPKMQKNESEYYREI